MATIKQYQEDPYKNYLKKTKMAESGGDNNAKAKTATGFNQNVPIWISIASLVSSVIFSIMLINKN